MKAWTNSWAFHSLPGVGISLTGFLSKTLPSDRSYLNNDKLNTYNNDINIDNTVTEFST